MTNDLRASIKSMMSFDLYYGSEIQFQQLKRFIHFKVPFLQFQTKKRDKCIH